jgi:hypothetical protein
LGFCALSHCRVEGCVRIPSTGHVRLGVSDLRRAGCGDDHTYFAIGIVQALEVLRGTHHVPDQPLIWHATGRTHGGRRVVRVGPGRLWRPVAVGIAARLRSAVVMNIGPRSSATTSPPMCSTAIWLPAEKRSSTREKGCPWRRRAGMAASPQPATPSGTPSGKPACHNVAGQSPRRSTATVRRWQQARAPCSAVRSL